VRWTAAEALGKLKDPKAVEPLIPILWHDTYQFAREKAAHALGKIGGARAEEALLACDNDPVSGVRQAAAEALKLMYAS
jgi:HEAT repeat protein